jgi:hypothetical protein
MWIICLTENRKNVILHMDTYFRDGGIFKEFCIEVHLTNYFISIS